MQNNNIRFYLQQEVLIFAPLPLLYSALGKPTSKKSEAKIRLDMHAGNNFGRDWLSHHQLKGDCLSTPL
jgi:hypothetical protein